MQVIAASDPNEKYGPAGLGGSSSINITQPFNYQIAFENMATASAAAQTVIIIDTLDLNVFDMSTVEFGAYGFGDRSVVASSPLAAAESFVDLRPGQDLIVRVLMRRDNASGVLRWDFTSLDPATMEPTTDVFAGFLPPNLTSPEGQGWVNFRVRTLPGLSDTVVISNDALIYFDGNEPIQTPPWTNTIDNTPPQSAVNPLPSTTSDTLLTVSWGGIDNDGGSGLADYTVYYTVNQGAPRLWLTNVSYTQAVFDAQVDSIYGFFTVARDSAMNMEGLPDGVDAQTVVVVGIAEHASLPNGNSLLSYPNPFTDQLTVAYEEKHTEGRTTLVILDALGRTVGAQVMYATVGRNLWQMDLIDLLPGTYILQAIKEAGTLSTVLIKQ
ncbi:MAG: T9SS type A sorting domain-containing protein [Flavobacteriales bacterium]|nr:T9SS type A sorting domain-containing protein [Flavobacteriales bacterium]